MLPKSVLSWIGHVVGIVAVVASPLAARAADAPDSDGPASATTKDVHHAHGRARAHSEARKRAAKRASRKAEIARSEAKRVHKEKADVETVEVKTEPVSTKRPPKPSPTPLPTVAAVTAAPLAEPIGMAATTHKASAAKMVIVAHAPEPSRTPITVSTRESTSHDGPSTDAPLATGSKKGKHGKASCLHAPIDVTRGTEEQAFPLTKCDGTAAPLAVEEMSILVRPGSAAKPSAPIADLAKKSGDELAPGIKRIDARLVERLQLVVDHFAKPAKTSKMFVVSGYRPSSKGSFHANGRAIDFRIDGVENTDLVAFCKTLPDTGCGFYPNSSFIHIDVRDAGTGRVAWIDASSPGEKPDYVAAWPPPPKADEDDIDPVKLLSKLDELQILPPSRASHVTKDADAKDKEDDDKAESKTAPASIGKRLDADVKKLEVDTKKLDTDVKKLDADDE